MHNKIPKMKKYVYPNEIIWMVQCLYIVNLMNEEMNKQYSIHPDKNSLKFSWGNFRYKQTHKGLQLSADLMDLLEVILDHNTDQSP